MHLEVKLYNLVQDYDLNLNFSNSFHSSNVLSIYTNKMYIRRFFLGLSVYLSAVYLSICLSVYLSVHLSMENFSVTGGIT